MAKKSPDGDSRPAALTTDGAFLPAEELVEALESEHPSDLFIGGSVHHATETITFWRGDLMPLTVPFSAFAHPATARGLTSISSR